jgi:hypothetical protein
MKHVLIFSALLLVLPYSAKVSAQSLGEQAVVGATGAASVGALYGAAKAINKPADPIVLSLQNQGYLNILPDPASPSQYKALDPRQGPVRLTVDPSTGQVTSVVPQ